MRVEEGPGCPERVSGLDRTGKVKEQAESAAGVQERQVYTGKSGPTRALAGVKWDRAQVHPPCPEQASDQ